MAPDELAIIVKELRDDTVRTRKIERVLMITGLTLLTAWFAARLHGTIGSRAAITQFEVENITNPTDGASVSSEPATGPPIDFRLWSSRRIAAHEDSLAKKTDAPLALLRIPKINLEAPVFNDTDDLTLNRGVGRIPGTAHIGESGNLGIAGHRDGFFRGLQSITPGDVVELARPRHTDKYVVSEIRIVASEDTYVLDPTSVPTLTLVTCFPFCFVGHAPKRYIVTAPLVSVGIPISVPTRAPFSTDKNTKIRRRNDIN